jgi:hypothetical protein
MTQTLDAGGGYSKLDSSHATGAPTSTTQTGAKFGTFAITFGIAFTLGYTVFQMLNWPLFTYMPAVGRTYFWLHRPLSGEGPPMFWYGWIVTSAISALVVGWIATMIPGGWLRRATVFCCVLAALWPAALAALRIYIVQWATFDADFLNSVWLAAIPAFVSTAVITYYVPVRLAELMWTRWLLVVPVGGLVVLGYGLLQLWFLR